MANRKLEGLTPHERKLRRAMQLRRSSYRCPACGATAQAKPGALLVCGGCLMGPAEAGAEDQMWLFDFAGRYPKLPAMVEDRRLVLTLSKRSSN